MNNVNNTLDSIKDTIREEISNFKKEQNKMLNNNNSKKFNYNNNKNGTLSSKELLS